MAFNVLYQRFVFADFDKTPNHLSDAYVSVDLDVTSNNHDEHDCYLYFLFSDYHTIKAAFSRLENARSDGNLNTADDVDKVLKEINLLLLLKNDLKNASDSMIKI